LRGWYVDVDSTTETESYLPVDTQNAEGKDEGRAVLDM
jgi:hypothetical protein